jgi:hypothetical protein
MKPMVRLPARFPALWFAATLCGSAALAGLALWVYAHARRPFDYMVVGTFGATAILALVFVLLVRRKML